MIMDTQTHNRLATLIIRLSRCAAERAMSSSWEHDPLFGIMVEKDEWAIAYQRASAEIETEFRKLKNNIEKK